MGEAMVVSVVVGVLFVIGIVYFTDILNPHG